MRDVHNATKGVRRLSLTTGSGREFRKFRYLASSRYQCHPAIYTGGFSISLMSERHMTYCISLYGLLTPFVNSWSVVPLKNLGEVVAIEP